ncbi:YhgE/Pip domain-containing protein [Paraclostridium sordellii]|uniref:YhgE/Pip domain-containing protein n=1 Tax=Paraclostridium sordellii TaxID=1505 RepID=UPI0005E0C5D0|nr:YhgE/Pip domain-containing protein [Paeniclostridium sordellii]CEP80744.1 phage infection protein [[Clostridium] sordellii] [Paeniclostridium sordellii]
MRKVFRIYLRDLKHIVTIPAAFIIVTVLCLIPSLYAWVNIKACWNPYVNTGNLPVAVVNQDEGTSVNGKFVNVGNEIVDQLKKDHNIGWKFVDEWQGNYQLNEGKFYALIEIPSDFSKDLATLTTQDPQKPNIIYKANEKVNAIATKITDVAKDKLVEEIKANFVDTVNEEAFSFLSSLGVKLEDNKPQILELKDALNSTSTNLEKINDYVKEANSHASTLKKYLKDTKGNLPKITQEVNDLKSVVNNSKDLVLSTQNSVNDASQNLTSSMNSINNLNGKLQNEINNLKNIDDSTSKDSLKDSIDSSLNLVTSLEKNIDKLIDFIEGLKDTSINNKVIDKLKNLKDILSSENDKLNNIKSLIDNNEGKDKINEQLNSLSDLVNSFNNNLNSISSSLTTDISNSLNSVGDAMVSSSGNINNVLDSINVIVPQLNALSSYGISSSDLAAKQATNISKQLDKFEKDLDTLIDKTKVLTDKNLDKLIDTLNKNSKEIASFISSPVNVKTVELYKAGIFGVALMPFYSVLAIWVGALLSTSLLTTECEELDREHTNLVQKHFGKMLTFMTVSLIQSLIIATGDIFLFQAPVSIPLLYTFTIVSSILFTTIIFTLVSLFGNVGKALAVFVMVFQIAGSGGIYPIQTNPKIFEVLQPFWPFTYAIDGFREAIAGPSMSAVYYDLEMLGVFFIIFLLLVILKKPFHKATEFMNDKFRESGL